MLEGSKSNILDNSKTFKEDNIISVENLVGKESKSNSEVIPDVDTGIDTGIDTGLSSGEEDNLTTKTINAFGISNEDTVIVNKKSCKNYKNFISSLFLAPFNAVSAGNKEFMNSLSYNNQMSASFYNSFYKFTFLSSTTSELNFGGFNKDMQHKVLLDSLGSKSNVFMIDELLHWNQETFETAKCYFNKVYDKFLQEYGKKTFRETFLSYSDHLFTQGVMGLHMFLFDCDNRNFSSFLLDIPRKC